MNFAEYAAISTVDVRYDVTDTARIADDLTFTFAPVIQSDRSEVNTAVLLGISA
jgi:hypothetical protein